MQAWCKPSVLRRASDFAEFEHEAAIARIHLAKRIIISQTFGKIIRLKSVRPKFAV